MNVINMDMNISMLQKNHRIMMIVLVYIIKNVSDRIKITKELNNLLKNYSQKISNNEISNMYTKI